MSFFSFAGPQCMKLDGIHTPTIFRLENSTGKSENCKGVSLMLFINNSEHCPEPVNINVFQLHYSSGKKEYKQIKSTEVIKICSTFIQISR